MLGFDRNLLLLFALNLAVSLSNQLITPLFPLYLESLQASEIEIGMVISLSSIVATALMLPSGILIDRIGKRRMLLLAAALAAFPPFFLNMIIDWRMVIPFYMIFNSSFSFFITSRMALIAESTTPQNRATIFSLMNITWPIGGIVGPVMSGYLIERYGWSISFFISATLASLSVIPAAMIREGKVETGRAPNGIKKASLFERRYLLFLGLFFAFHVAQTTAIGGVNMIIPLFLEDKFHLSYHLIGLFFTASSTLMLFTQIPSGYLADRYSRRKLIAAFVMFPPLLLGIWPFIEDWTMLIVLYTASMGFWSMTWPATSALLSDSVSSELLGTAFGIRMTGVRLGFTIGPTLSGFLYTTYGHSTPFFAATFFHLIVIPLALLIKENYNEDNRSNEDGKRILPGSTP